MVSGVSGNAEVDHGGVEVDVRVDSNGYDGIVPLPTFELKELQFEIISVIFSRFRGSN